MKLFIATYWQGGELQWEIFASDGTRKMLEEEFLESYNAENPDYPLERDEVQSVHALTEVYDYTKKKNYKLILRAK